MNVRNESSEVVGAMDVIRQRHAENLKSDAAYQRSYSRLLARQERAIRMLDTQRGMCGHSISLDAIHS